MYARINFSTSNVPSYERDTYLEKLASLARESKYQRVEVYRADSPDWIIIVKSQYPGDFPCKEKEFKQILCGLKRRKCTVDVCFS